MTTALHTVSLTRSLTRSLARPHARYEAPARFDAHTVETFETWVAQQAPGGHHLIVDLSAVVFMDLYAVEALQQAQTRAAAADRALEFESLSIAARITLEMLAARPAELAMAA